MADPKKRTTNFFTLKKDFATALEALRIRIEFRIECYKHGRTFHETLEQLQWAREELDRIRAHFKSKLPWPSSGFDLVVRGWAAESDLRKDLLILEREYLKNLK